MVSSTFNEHSLTGRIVVQANRSLSWSGNLLLIVSLAGIALVISVVFLLQGYWLILPFGIIEIAVVTIGLYACARDSIQQEIITLDPLSVSIERGHQRVEERYQYNRGLSVFHVGDRSSSGQRTLSIRSRGRELPIGEFLNEDDRNELILRLRNMIRKLDESTGPGIKSS